jgi:maltose alpha-D-glucosyltransferase/alpha-amylase
MLPANVSALKTRYHGDYHLGQVLVVQNDFYVIDFEGEPMRPMAERRNKASPLKDVAGMLRSFDYAAATAVRDIADIQPASQEAVVSCARQWRDRVIGEFLDGYFEEMQGCPSLPADAAERRALLDFFTLDKAFYEVGYELANRPNWIAIPLGGVVRLLGLEEERDDVAG